MLLELGYVLVGAFAVSLPNSCSSFPGDPWNASWRCFEITCHVARSKARRNRSGLGSASIGHCPIRRMRTMPLAPSGITRCAFRTKGHHVTRGVSLPHMKSRGADHRSFGAIDPARQVPPGATGANRSWNSLHLWQNDKQPYSMVIARCRARTSSVKRPIHDRKNAERCGRA